MTNRYANACLFLGIMLLTIGCATNGPYPDPAAHEEHVADGHGHESALLELQTNGTVPALELQMAKDAVTGWNLHIVTEGFTWAPEHAGLAHVPGEGHAHVYVDGVKVARVYGPWYHLAVQPRNDVRVELTSNDHRTYATNGIPLAASINVERNMAGDVLHGRWDGN